MSGLIRDRLIVQFAVEQQIHGRARLRPAGDDRFTRRLDASNVEGWYSIATVRLRGRTGQCGRQAVHFRLCRRKRGWLCFCTPDASFGGPADTASALTGGSWRTDWNVKTRATLQAATNAINGMTIRLMDLAVMVFARRPDRQLIALYSVFQRGGLRYCPSQPAQNERNLGRPRHYSNSARQSIRSMANHFPASPMMARFRVLRAQKFQKRFEASSSPSASPAKPVYSLPRTCWH